MPPVQSFIDCVRNRCLGTYVIFSMQRSASTTLCGDLRKWDANCTYELLNTGAGNAGMEWSHRLGISPNFVGSHPSEFIDRVRAALHRPPLFGFKVFPTHPFPPSYITPSTTCVVLRRQNVTEQFISTQIARKSGCWATDGTTECHNATWRVNAKDLARFSRESSEWFARVEKLCAGAKTTLRVTTEAYLRERPALLAPGV